MEGYMRKKRLKAGGKSEYVYLLENSEKDRVIKKKYNPNLSIHRKHFRNEVRILDHLQKCDFVPNIIKIDKEDMVIYMSYCGKSLDYLDSNSVMIPKYKKKIKELMKILDQKWNVSRQVDGTKMTKIGLNNVCLNSDGKLSLIDFGSLYWRINE